MEADDRARLVALFEVGLAAADPEAAVRDSLAGHPPEAPGGALVLAVGKAALRMLAGASDWMAARPVPPRVIVVTNRENAPASPPPAGATLILAGHPVPDAEGLRAGRMVVEALEGLTGDERVLLLLSGGASALLPAPAEGLGLEDKALVSRLLLASGAPIKTVNLVRQHLSRLKGGGLARLAAPARVTALVVSDVVGDDLRAVGSGPAADALGSRVEAARACRSHGVWDALPAAVRGRLEAPEPAMPPAPAELRLVGSGALSLAAMARAAPEATLHRAPLTGDVADAAGRLAALPPGLHLMGGETTVRVRGRGLGGRNQELALRVALGMSGRFAFLSAGTDGRDGPTDAAGAVVDDGTVGRIRAAGLDAHALLADNDAHRALGASGDLLITGGTGTNVADLQILRRG